MEQVEIIDTNGNVLKVVTRKESIEKNLCIKGAFVIVDNGSGKYYIQKRSMNKEIYPGLWAAGAGGGVAVGETFEDAAHRELEEELGIKADVRFIFDFSFKSEVSNYKSKIYITVYNGEVTPNTEEIETGKWASKQEIEEMESNGQLCPDTAQYMKIYFDKFS